MWGGCLGFGSPQLKAAGTCPPRTRDDAPKRMVRSADTPDGHLPTEPAAFERQGPEQEPPCTNAIRASPIAHLDGQAPSSGQMASLRKRSIPRPRRHTPAGRRMLSTPAIWQPSSEAPRRAQYTWLEASHEHAAVTCRAARAHGLVRAWVWATERARWSALTRSTGRSLVVVWSSPHAAGPSRRRSARALGTRTARRRPLPAELEQAASATSGPIARSAQGAVWQW